MKKAAILLGSLLLLPAGAEGQETPFQQRLKAVADNCEQRFRAHVFHSYVETINCSNDGITDAYKSVKWPYMDVVYELESSLLLNAAKADAKKISQPEYDANIRAAVLHMNSEIEQKNQQRRAEIAAAEQRREDAAITERQRQESADEQQNQEFLGALILRGAPFRQPGINCFTSSAVGGASTHCQ